MASLRLPRLFAGAVEQEVKTVPKSTVKSKNEIMVVKLRWSVFITQNITQKYYFANYTTKTAF